MKEFFDVICEHPIATFLLCIFILALSDVITTNLKK